MLRNTLQGFILRHVGCIHHIRDSAKLRGERLVLQLTSRRRHNADIAP